MSSALATLFTDEGYLSPIGKPYQPTELQRRFIGMSLRDIYTLICKKQNCKANSGVLKSLSERVGDFDAQMLDFSHNYVGPRGVVPVVELTKLMPRLRTLNLADNYLDNKSIYFLAKAATFHPTLNTLDVSLNPLTWTAGMSILELVTRNTSITKVHVEHTMLKTKVTDAIIARCRLNLTEGNAPRRQAKPTNHQIAIHIRALKRTYRELSVADGSVSKRAVIQGFKEYLKLKGQEVLIKELPVEAFEEVVRRTRCEGAEGTQEGTIDWECYMLSVLTTQPYDSTAVANLRKVFQLYDVDGVGFVDAADMKQMLTVYCGNKGVPTDAEVKQRLDLLDADATMTLSWEEFLYIMWIHVPSDVGDVAILPTATPMTKPLISHR
eukprot:PhF_6_TR4540/c0_g1_i1/m.6389